MEHTLSNMPKEAVSVPAETEIGGEIRLNLVPADNGILQLDTTVDSLIIAAGYFEGRYSIDRTPCARIPVKSNQLFWIPVGHEFQLRTASYSAELIVIEFPVSLRERNIQASGSTNVFQQPRIGITSTKSSTILESMVRSFITSGGFGGRPVAEAISQIAMTEVRSIFEDKNSLSQPSTMLSKHLLDKIIQYVDEHCTEKIKQEKLATIVNLSVFHFSRIFKETTGVSPHQFVIERRVNKSKDLLAKSEDCIAEVAYKTGFSSQSHMTDTFRRLLNTTPREYRQKRLAQSYQLAESNAVH